MRVLGIESSCDETAAAVVASSSQQGLKLLSNSVASSVDLHKAYGGVVPEIAARSHLESILPVIEDAMEVAEAGWDDIDAIAVTVGPGLSGSLLIGSLTARTLAIAKNKPLFPVNHVEAHIYAAFLTKQGAHLSTTYELPATAPKFPILALIVSGGHTQLVLFKNHFRYKVLGRTLDDAVGEAFDKVAKVLGLPYPGGPSVSEAAQKGNPGFVKLPSAKLKESDDFSYSGLKTAVLRRAQEVVGKDYTFPSHQIADLLTDEQRNNLAATFQKTAIESLITGLKLALDKHKPKSIVIAGGVAANGLLRQLAKENFSPTPIFPDIKLCVDNGAMIAANGFFQLKLGCQTADPYSLEIDPQLSMLA